MKYQRISPLMPVLFMLLPVDGAFAGDSYTNQAEPVPNNIFFLIDFSASMGSCWAKDQKDLNNDGVVEYYECDPARNSSDSVWHLTTVKEALKSIVSNMDNANFGLALTDPTYAGNPDGIGDRPTRDGIVVPLGSSKSEFLAALDEIRGGPTQGGTVTVNALNAAPLTEALDNVGYYFQTGAYTSKVGYADIPPISFYCQESHVILITDGVTSLTSLNPDIDKKVSSAGTYLANPDLTDNKPYTVEGAYNQMLDNVASYLANSDMSILSDSEGQQHVITHIVALDSDEQLFENATENSGGIYATVSDPDELAGELWTIVNGISSGTYVKAPPTVATSGDALYLGYFEVKPERPLYYGHLLSFDIDTDPYSAQYGEIDTTLEQPAWDAGVILASRLVGQQDVMSRDNNGTGLRDIYTNMDDDNIPDPFDATNLNKLCPLMLDLSTDALGTYNGVAEGHDVDQDLDVDIYDCANLMDFVRGFHMSEFVSTGEERGYWKLGDIRHSQVAIADREPKIYTRNPYLRDFLDNSLPQTINQCPYASASKCALDVVFVAANDGMLHAFAKGSGDELWAYIPGNLLGERAGVEETAEILDMMYGESVNMDATARVEYVWIDGYQGDGQVSPGAADGEQDTSEWLRVLVFGQGAGGRYYTALDITDPQYPFILWEDTNDAYATTEMGATTSTAAIGLIFDQDNDPAYDRWVAFYGSGHEEETSIQARLYIKAFEDKPDTAAAAEVYSDEGYQVEVDLDGDGADDGRGFPSNPTAIDFDNDGDIDEVFLVNSAGAMYKFVIDTSNIDSTTGCLFFDPENAYVPSSSAAQYIGKRSSAYWAATAAYNTDGHLVLYWGTGSPYDLFTEDYGYFYAVMDSPGCIPGRLYTDCRGDGYLRLEKGEKLTGSPVVYAGGIYFSTFLPSSDRCKDGSARLYGLSHIDCSVALDTNGDGEVDSKDQNQDYVDLGSGIPSGIVVANDSIYVATSAGLDEDTIKTDAVHRIDVENDIFSGTVAIQWRELF